MSVRVGDAVTVRAGETVYAVEPFPAADQFCIPVLKLTDEETGTDCLLVLAEDVHPADRAMQASPPKNTPTS